jgi:hypothetical protein
LPLGMYKLAWISTHANEKVVRQKNIFTIPIGSGTKNDFAGENQQQFTRTCSCNSKIKNVLGSVWLYQRLLRCTAWEKQFGICRQTEFPDYLHRF